MADSCDDANGRNLIVNYIPQTYTESDLLNLFKPFGQIESCKIVVDRNVGIGKSLGYGFVKFFDERDASNAIAHLSGTQVANKVLKVSIAKPPSSTIKVGNLYVSGLDAHSSDDTLKNIFAPFGNILETKTLIDYNTNQCRGVGFVRFRTKDEAQNAIRALNNQSIPQLSKPIHVKFAENNEEKKREMRGGMVRKSNTYIRYDPYANVYPGYGFNPTNISTLPAVNSFFGNPQSVSPVSSVPMIYSQSPVVGIQTEGPTLFVYNIPPYSDDNLLYQLFCPFGAISAVKIIRDESTQLCKGYGFVAFINLENAQQAILALNGYKLHGKALQVSFKKSK